MPSPFYDGDFTIAKQVGQPIFSAPFPADPLEYVYRVTYWQLRASFEALEKDTNGPYGGFFIGGEMNFRDLDGGIVSFEREFAILPGTRNEFESFVYSYQCVLGGTSVVETPLNSLSRVQYDYFRTATPYAIWKLATGTVSLTNGSATVTGSGTNFDPEIAAGNLVFPSVFSIPLSWNKFYVVGSRSSDTSLTLTENYVGTNISGASLYYSDAVGAIPLPRAPKALQVCSGVLLTNGFGSITPYVELLAEDATFKVWKGNIYERKMRFITAYDLTV